jgi:hypothetical protein
MEQIRVVRGNALFTLAASRSLTWWPELGLGYYPVVAGTAPYDDAYFDRFAKQADTPIGRQLMTARVNFVDQHWPHTMVDVGIGSGAFIEARGKDLVDYRTFGYDVCPKAKRWLHERKLFWNVENNLRIQAVSFWDVFEHIQDFSPLIEKIDHWVFISIPIFRDCEHVLESKHFRKDEHCWYFTANGLEALFHKMGFDLKEFNLMESDLGREDIGTFAFKRRAT